MASRRRRTVLSHLAGSYAVSAVGLAIAIANRELTLETLLILGSTPFLLPLVLVIDLLLWHGYGRSRLLIVGPVYLAGAAALNVMFTLADRRDRRIADRHAAGLCVTCGYDLRAAASDRCPECGRPLPLWRLRDHSWSRLPDPPTPPPAPDD